MPAWLAVWAFAALLCLVLATEARAADGPAESDGATAVETGSSSSPTDEAQAPAAEDPLTTDPPAEEPPVDEAPPVEAPAPEAPAPEAPAPEAPAPEAPAPEAPAPEAPAPEAPAPEAPAPEPPADTPSPGEPPGPVAESPPVEVPSAGGSHRDSIVMISRDASQLRTPLGFLSSEGGLAAGNSADDPLDSKGGSRSEAASEGSQAAQSAGDSPLRPGLPFGDGAPSAPYVSAGGMGGGSSGGFFPLVITGLVTLFAAQRPGGVVPVTLAPPHCATSVLCLERPD
jgi:outer membrane biosynthesis protein TonB